MLNRLVLPAAKIHVEPGWREESFDFGVEIERSIFAEPGQQLSMTFSWP